MTALLWLRRDLRRHDHPALAAAHQAAAGRGVLVTFVLDPDFWDDAGPVRQAWLARTLIATNATFDGRLCLRMGNPVEVIPALMKEVEAGSVHVSRETEPGGHARDERVQAALDNHRAGGSPGDALWVESGTPYAVEPGTILNQQGTPFQVFTPFSKAWREHGWPEPVREPRGLRLLEAPSDPEAWAIVQTAAIRDGLPDLPEAGEAAAVARWAEFLADDVAAYKTNRDRPDLDATSRLSPYLKFGVVHPRTLLADLALHPSAGATSFINELAWREFYADVLWHHPTSLTRDLKPALAGLAYDVNPAAFEAWKAGRTGYPIVDAGMRQLLQEGWMHNRVRMITASFLTKDLHQWWPAGAAHFLEHLIDGDLASNAHGWQWTAGTGTDAAPYFRVFNPTLQGVRFDPNGDYVRRYVPELAHLPGAAVHEPWKHPAGYSRGYAQPIVDHAAERDETLRRYRLTKEDARIE